MRRKLTLLVMVALVILPAALLAAQGAGTTIGLVLPREEDALFAGLTEAAQAYADAEGITLVVTNAAGDLDTEAAAVQDMLDQGVDALLLYPLDSVDSLTAVAAANSAEVPVFLLGQDVTYDAAMETVEVAGVVAPSAEAIGEAVGSFFCEALAEGEKLVALAGFAPAEEDMMAADDSASTDSTAGDSSSGDDMMMADYQRAEYATRQAQLDALAAYMADNCAGVEVAVEASETYSNADSLAFLNEALADRDVDGVFAANDALVTAALDAALAARVRGIQFVTLETTEDTLGALESNDVAAIVSAVPDSLGTLAVQTAAAYLNGEMLDEDTAVVEVITVTADSIESVFRGCPPTCGVSTQGNIGQ